MILNNGHSTNYLNDFKEGKIVLGQGIGCELDTYLRFKRKQLNIVLGHDNVGKSYWMEWYFLCLNLVNGLSCTVWMGENSSGQVMRDLIQFSSGKYLKDLSYNELRHHESKVESLFKFVDNSKLYTPEQLLDLFSSSKSDYFFIDPFTGLDRDMSHEGNYRFLNNARQFCNTENKTIYLSTHPNSESGRSGMIYPQDHHWFGHLKPPLKAHIEGGKPFLNRCDDMIVIHRLVKHQDMKYQTMINIDKIKDQDTGGQQTELNVPLLFDFNKGLGFTVGSVNPLVKFQNEKIKDDSLPF